MKRLDSFLGQAFFVTFFQAYRQISRGGVVMRIFSSWLIVWIFILAGCDEQIENKQMSVSIIQPTSYGEKPPELMLSIGNDVIKIMKGAYSWQHYNSETGEHILTQTDHAPPTDMVNILEGKPVQLTDPINMTFAVAPTSYEVNVWNDKEIISTYPTIADIQERGHCILEIVGYFGESRATYVTALTIQ